MINSNKHHNWIEKLQLPKLSPEPFGARASSRFIGGLMLLLLSACDGSSPALTEAAADTMMSGVTPASSSSVPKTVVPGIETVPVMSSGDAADDPAIWIHPDDPSLSLILGTDKALGIDVFNLHGERVQSIEAGRTNNIDLRMLPTGSHWSALAAASNRSSASISLFALDQAGQLHWLQESEISTGVNDPYGLCMFANELGLQVFVNYKSGQFQHWGLQEVDQGGSGSELPHYEANLLREFFVTNTPEGCVADDQHQRLFLGVEAEGVKVVPARHDAEPEVQTIANVDREILSADVEGMSLFLDGDSGYLVVSSQGSNSFAVYDRLPPFAYKGNFVIGASADGSIDESSDTDGVAISSSAMGGLFPFGLLVAQDGVNTSPSEAQNFKLVSWQEIASKLNL